MVWRFFISDTQTRTRHNQIVSYYHYPTGMNRRTWLDAWCSVCAFASVNATHLQIQFLLLFCCCFILVFCSISYFKRVFVLVHRKRVRFLIFFVLAYNWLCRVFSLSKSESKKWKEWKLVRFSLISCNGDERTNENNFPKDEI